MQKYRVAEVFQPNSFPQNTYVARQDRDYERDLRRALESPGSIVSLSGPSKSGKSVLGKRVVPEADRLWVSCSSVQDATDVWNEAFRALGISVRNESEESRTHTTGAWGEGGGKVRIPLIAEGESSAGGSYEHGRGRTTRSEALPPGVPQAIEALVARAKTVVLDDFHILRRETQTTLGRQLKHGAEKGLKTLIISVPHRGDDPVLAVPDLRGRVTPIEVSPWKADELVEIPRKGFPLLNVDLAREAEERLAKEALGSPLLMQKLSKQTCESHDIEETLPEQKRLVLDDMSISAVLRATARSLANNTEFQTLAAGPTRSTGRRLYDLVEGSKLDIYHLVLAAAAIDPIESTIPFSDLRQRVRRILVPGDAPDGRTLQRAVQALHRLAETLGRASQPPEDPVFQWEPLRGGIVTISNPYFLFDLRWNRYASLHQPIL